MELPQNGVWRPNGPNSIVSQITWNSAQIASFPKLHGTLVSCQIASKRHDVEKKVKLHLMFLNKTHKHIFHVFAKLGTLVRNRSGRSSEVTLPTRFLESVEIESRPTQPSEIPTNSVFFKHQFEKNEKYKNSTLEFERFFFCAFY